MQSGTYFLLEGADRAVIVHGKTGLRVNVFSLETEGYSPNSDELHVFGNDHGEWLAFETDGWTIEAMDLVTGAVVWYTHYLDHPEMVIRTKDPRPQYKLRKI